MKKTNIKPRKNYLLYVIGGVLILLAALLFSPRWAKTTLPWAGWGTAVVNLMIAVCLALYLINYLLPKVLHGGKGAIHILVIVEFVLLTLIALGCLLSQFQVIHISGACAIFGFCMLTRGVVEIFRAYYYKADGTAKYPLWWLIVSLLMVIFGTYLMAKPLFTDMHLLWLFVAVLFVYGLYLCIFGLRCKPKKEKTAKKAEKKETAEKK